MLVARCSVLRSTAAPTVEPILALGILSQTHIAIPIVRVATSLNVMMSRNGIVSQRRAKSLPTSVARCSWFTRQGCNFLKSDAPNVLVQTVRRQSVWSVDPWWMLAQTSCCARPLVAGRSWSRHRQRAQARFFDVTRVPVTRKFRQRAASISETTSRRRCSMLLLRKSNPMPQIGGRACGFHVFCFCEVVPGPFHSVANRAIVLQQVRAA